MPSSLPRYLHALRQRCAPYAWACVALMLAAAWEIASHEVLDHHEGGDGCVLCVVADRDDAPPITLSGDDTRAAPALYASRFVVTEASPAPLLRYASPRAPPPSL